MKAFLTILFTLLYLTASSSAPVQLRLCKGQVVDMKLLLVEGENCDTDCPSGKQKTKDCCKYKQQQLKVDNLHEDALKVQAKLVYLAAILPYPTQALPAPVSSILVEYPKSNGPPITGKIALYIKNCTFLI